MCGFGIEGHNFMGFHLMFCKVRDLISQARPCGGFVAAEYVSTPLYLKNRRPARLFHQFFISVVI